MQIDTTENSGTVKVTLQASRVGPFVFTIGAATDEFVRVRSEAFTWRGRTYHGVIMLSRGNLEPAYGYMFMLKSERDVSASQRVWQALGKAVGAEVAHCL